MKNETDLLTPPKRLALAYCPKPQRAFFALILEFDARLGKIVVTANEPLVAQMRIAWWRDVIGKTADDRPSGEPLIALLNELESDDAYKDAELAPDISRSMLNILEAWDFLLSQENWDDALLSRHAEKKGEAFFGPAASRDGQYNYAQVGRLWALYDLANISGADVSGAVEEVQKSHRQKWQRMPSSRRHLSVLAMAARKQYQNGGLLAGLRIMLHGITGC